MEVFEAMTSHFWNNLALISAYGLTIESLNSVIRQAIKKRKVFPTDDPVRKVIYLAIRDASKKWCMSIQNWRLAMSRFINEFGDRQGDHL